MMRNNNQLMNNNNNPMMRNNNPMMNNNNSPMMRNNNPMMNNNNNPMMNNNNNPMMNNNNNPMMNNNNNPMMNNNNEMQEQLIGFNSMRNIINLYEKRIKFLEEQIKKKDFEIMNLKNRLSSNFSFNQNMQPFNNVMMMQQMMNFMNRINFINQLNDYNKIMNINNNNSAKYLTLVFSINNNLKINIQCKSNDKMESVIKHFLAKCCFTDNNSYIYIYNGKKINDNLTVEESGIYDHGIIFVIDKKDEAQFQNISEISISHLPMINLFFTLRNGNKIHIIIEGDARISDAIRKFFNKVNIVDSDIKEKIYFLYNGLKIDPNDDKKIKDIFVGGAIIYVIETTNVYGA